MRLELRVKKEACWKTSASTPSDACSLLGEEATRGRCRTPISIPLSGVKNDHRPCREMHRHSDSPKGCLNMNLNGHNFRSTNDLSTATGLQGRRMRALIALLAAISAALILSGSSSAWMLNVVQLDNGTCGQNLQRGSNKTASSSATPSFLLWADGGRVVEVFVDGVSIGVFRGDPYANACIYTSSPLADGPHRLTANELAPNPANTVTPLNFSVDTQPPAAPTTPVLASFSDSGVRGDNLTRFRSFTLTGTADPLVSAQVYSGASVLGGAGVDSTGTWSAAASVWVDGAYSLRAAALDSASNQSAFSGALSLNVDSVAPSGGFSSPTDGGTLAGTLDVTATGADQSGSGRSISNSTTCSCSRTAAARTPTSGTPTALATRPTLSPPSSTTLPATPRHPRSPSPSPTAPAPRPAPPPSPPPRRPTTASASPGAPQQQRRLRPHRLPRLSRHLPGSGVPIATLGTLTSYTDSTALNGTTYYYQVSALNAVGEGSRSNERSATPTAPATAPGPPPHPATAGNGTVTLTWTPPASNGGPPSPATASTAAPPRQRDPARTRSAPPRATPTVPPLNGTTYYYQVSAINAVGEGPRSDRAFGHPGCTRDRPRPRPRSTRPRAGNGSVSLFWSAPPPTAAPRSPATRSTAAPPAAARASRHLGDGARATPTRPRPTASPTTTRSAP